jgi:hypothetical protein
MLDFKDFLPIETAPFDFPFLAWIKSCERGEPGIYVVYRLDSSCAEDRDELFLYEEGDTYGMPTTWKGVTGGWLQLPQEAFVGTHDYAGLMSAAKAKAVSDLINKECVRVFNENGGGDHLLWWLNGRVFNYDELEAICLNSINDIKTWY